DKEVYSSERRYKYMLILCFCIIIFFFFFFSSRRRHTRSKRDWSSDVCSFDLGRYDLRWRRFKSEPMRMEAPTKWPTFSPPTTFMPRIQCKPVLAMHPHCEQSGVPPKTQGSTRVRRSAE